MGLGFRRWRGWIIGSYVVKIRWLWRTLGVRVEAFMKGVWVTLPTLAIASGVGGYFVVEG